MDAGPDRPRARSRRAGRKRAAPATTPMPTLPARSADTDADAEAVQLELLRRWHLHLVRTDRLPAAERAMAGKTLAKLGDPRFDPDLWFLPREPLLGFVEVPAGPFRMGEGKEVHEVELPAFYMARHPVTVAQFRAFVSESGHEVASRALAGVANHPVADVTWHDAVAYCRWLTERLRELARTRAAAERRSHPSR